MKASEFRANARETLGGRLFGAPWLFSVLVLFLYTAINALLSNVLGFFGAVASLVFTGPLSIALVSYFVGCVRGGKHDTLKPLATGFTKDLGGNIVMGLLTTLYIFLWTLLFLIPGIVKSYSYALAPYIKHDSDLSAKDAIRTSCKMMDGNKWRLFCLDFSFTGWYIVGSLCLGVGVFWVMAYHYSARAHFYQELLSRKMAEYQASKGGAQPAQQPAAAPARPAAPAARPDSSDNINNDKFI